MSEQRDFEPGEGSGGGPLGTPSEGDEVPPSQEQDANSVVSGGGVVGPSDDDGPSDAATR